MKNQQVFLKYMKKILFLCFGLVVSVSLTAQLPERNAGNLKKYKAICRQHIYKNLNSATHIVRNKFKILSNNILPSILPCQKIHLT